mmetsp:Transcript_8844/g.26495  ORF Transcript_8844/g.26495 Transcript_8844/m.26495 type:complete len:787 (+) Transcript_8844:200-2560(+)
MDVWAHKNTMEVVTSAPSDWMNDTPQTNSWKSSTETMTPAAFGTTSQQQKSTTSPVMGDMTEDMFLLDMDDMEQLDDLPAVARQAASFAASPGDDFISDMPSLDLGAMDLSEPNASPLPPALPPLPQSRLPAPQQPQSPPWGSAPATSANWHRVQLVADSQQHFRHNQQQGSHQGNQDAISSPQPLEVPTQLQQHYHNPYHYNTQPDAQQLDMQRHAKLDPLPAWQPVKVERSGQEGPQSGGRLGMAGHSAPTQLQPQPLPVGLSSALRSQSIPDGNSLGPPLWLSSNGTASGSPPVRSHSWGLPPMSSIPEGGGQMPSHPQPQLTQLQQQQQHAYSLPLPDGPGQWPQPRMGMPQGWMAVPQTVVQTPPPIPLHQPGMHYGSAPTHSGFAAGPGGGRLGRSQSGGREWGTNSGLPYRIPSGLGSYDGLDEVMDHDRGAGGTTPRTQLLRQGEYGQGLSGRQPRSAPPITPLRMSRRIQGRGKQTYCEYDRAAFSNSESETFSGSEDEEGGATPASRGAPRHPAGGRAGGDRGASLEYEDRSPSPLTGSPSQGGAPGSLGSSGAAWSSGCYQSRLLKHSSLGAGSSSFGSLKHAGHGSFVSRSGRTVRRGPRGYSPEPDPTRELSSSLPRNYGASARPTSSGGTVKRKRATHVPVALRDSADTDAAGQRRKQHNPWTREETEALVDGVERCGGAGKWQDIKRLGLPPLQGRSAVDLKDKWRNLLRVAELPPAQASARADKKREGPSSHVLDRVRELAVVTQAKAAASEARIPSSRSRTRGRVSTPR